MNINLSKTILICIVLFTCTTLRAQEKFDVTLKNDTVFNNGTVLFICEGKSNDKASVYSLRSLDKKLQGVLIFRYEGDKIKFSGTFPYLEVRYTCMYPKIEILTLMDSYVRNKVFVGDHASLAGLEAYCKERNLVLERQPKHSSKTPEMRDSILAARAKEDMKNQVKFVIHNNAPTQVRVFIGNKPKGGSGRIQPIAPYGNLSEHARKTEKVFLINDAGDEIKSIAVTDSLTRIVIKASADGFE